MSKRAVEKAVPRLKDIYCQKPLGLTVRDGQEMIRAVRKHSRILQTGSQWRSNALFRQVCNAVRNEPLSPVEVGHRTVTVCHLGNIAMKLNSKFRWDPKDERIVGDDEAGGLLPRAHRAPWGYA